eukprot:gnl/TRDRNA2_/TRDRNA2_177414_c0_seq2.p1 gnl/TRDRNA2_/TRDRNA2_177414_c0~~gnl/TRDRNA2_/TRDRNA2_177414_c0_seq2.p1  ORF type:complete len:438 (-),score=34.48 gnl/TRDRNA2_/TRDRNA2_177414_c0_seq2:208-1521(-)
MRSPALSDAETQSHPPFAVTVVLLFGSLFKLSSGRIVVDRAPYRGADYRRVGLAAQRPLYPSTGRTSVAWPWQELSRSPSPPVSPSHSFPSPLPPPPSLSRTLPAKGHSPSDALALFMVPILWGTFTPSMLVLVNSPDPPVAAELCAVRFCLGAIVLAPTFLQSQGAAKSAGKMDSTWRAGVELGMYEILAQGLQAYGLEHTTAAKAGFLLSTINVMVPAMAAMGGQQVTTSVWGACALSLLGVHILRGSGADVSVGDLSGSDAFLLAAATVFAWHNVRMGLLAPKLDTTKLTAAKCAVMASGSSAWYVLSAHGGDMWASSFWHGGHAAQVAWAAAAYNALVPGSLATLLQVRGQASLPVTQANLIFATSPVFTAAFAAALLGETLSQETLRGGAIIIAASLLPIIFPSTPKEQPQIAAQQRNKQHGLLSKSRSTYT